MAKQQRSSSDLSRIQLSMNDLLNRIRVLEQLTEKMDILISSLEKEVRDTEKRLLNRINEIDESIEKMDSRLRQVEVSLDKLKSEVDKKASKMEVKELSSLLELFSPIKSVFVTKEQVKMIVEEILEKKKKVETNI
ncbi:MAG: hypothetical protein J7K83_03445 [Candidatus Aenigmarchaeota archaeon]|nr:hypothetical protein [Candidatus Aenigmarchaeota archaeon]